MRREFRPTKINLPSPPKPKNPPPKPPPGAAEVRKTKLPAPAPRKTNSPATNQPARAALRRYVEPRYLHQVIARNGAGQLARAIDLSDDLIDHPPSDLGGADVWRVHFH